MAPEPEGPSPYSQEPATGPYPEPTGSNLHSPSQSSWDPFWSHPPIYALVRTGLYFRPSEYWTCVLTTRQMDRPSPISFILVYQVILDTGNTQHSIGIWNCNRDVLQHMNSPVNCIYFSVNINTLDIQQTTLQHGLFLSSSSHNIFITLLNINIFLVFLYLYIA
jgi:hypothetical protein